jgi:hypothetical protein
MEHKIRRVDYNCRAGEQFSYFCDDCSLHLRGYNNKHYLDNLNGWTWELTDRTGVKIATAGNENSQSYGGTEADALADGLKRFNEEPCHKPN